MATVKEIYGYLDELYPFETQMSFDNAGFLLGDGEQAVQKILVALDITSTVIEEAISLGCKLIVTHHPVIFTPLKTLLAQNPTEKMIMRLIQHDISVISAHTNLDRSAEGVNFHLARALELKDISFVIEEGTDRFGRLFGTGFFGQVSQTGLSASAYSQFVTQALDSEGTRFTDTGKSVSLVAVGGGSCSSILADVKARGCDTFVTGDVKYDVFLMAQEMGINLIDAGHYPTEQVICPVVAEKLQGYFAEIEVILSQKHQEVSKSLF